MTELVVVGTFTAAAGGRGAGIHAFARDARTGDLHELAPPVPADEPSFLAGSADGRFLYAVVGWDAGGVRTLAITPSGALQDLGVRPAGGAVPCHLTVSPDGGFVLVAHYGSGSVSVHRVNAGGRLAERTDLVSFEGSGPVRGRQDAPHAHHVSMGPDGTVRVTDLGADAIRAFTLDHGRLRPGPVTATRPGSGPRHLATHPDGRLFVANELDATVSMYRVAGSGDLREEATVASTVSPSRKRTYPSELAVSPDGRFLYVANRGADTVTTFGGAGGAVEPLSETPAEGEWPRHLALIGDHLYVANERSHTVAIFAVDARTGVPSFTGRAADVASPACVVAVQGTRVAGP